jgi:hypothetical protein
MSKVKVTNTSEPKQKMRPALTPDAREKQLAAAAYDLSEQRLLDGTASAQEIVYWLKVGSMREKAERERLAEENKLLRAKTKAIEDDKENRVLYEDAIKAMRNYSGHGDPEEYCE